MIHWVLILELIRVWGKEILSLLCFFNLALQYKDDTIFLIQDDIESASNLKFNLCLFEQLSGLKINFHKSEVFCLGEATDRQDSYAEIFTCKLGHFL